MPGTDRKHVIRDRLNGGAIIMPVVTFINTRSLLLFQARLLGFMLRNVIEQALFGFEIRRQFRLPVMSGNEFARLFTYQSHQSVKAIDLLVDNLAPMLRGERFEEAGCTLDFRIFYALKL